MFSDEILEKIFSHKETSKIPIWCQSTMIHVIEEVLEDIENVNEFQQYIDSDSRNISDARWDRYFNRNRQTW